MADVFSRVKRSEIMGRIRSKNTKPELFVRKALTAKGIRFRLNAPLLPGKPDIIIPRLKTAVFVNGCFWHQHRNCKRLAMPKTNIAYWKPKLERNVLRQRQNVMELKKFGWKVLIVWECQAVQEAKLARRLSGIS